LSLTGDELKARVNKLRAEIDPKLMVCRAALPGQFRIFRRQASFELYQVLLGDRGFNRYSRTTVLLFVRQVADQPAAGLLVTLLRKAARRGPRSRGVRATAWLLRSRPWLCCRRFPHSARCVSFCG